MATVNQDHRSGVDGKAEWTQAKEKAADAVSSAGEMASQAAAAVSTFASDAIGDVGKQVDNLAVSAGQGIQEWGDSINKSAAQAGVLGGATQMVARTVKESGEYLEEAKFSGLARDVAQLIRQNPIPAFFIALGLGWLVAAKMRS